MTWLLLSGGVAAQAPVSAPVEGDLGPKEKVSVTVAPEKSYPPFTWVDEQGVHRGISADILALIAKKTSLRFELLEGRPLDENLRLAREGKVDLLTSLAMTPERSVTFSFSEPYFSVPAVLVLRQGWKGAPDLGGLVRRRVGVGKGYAVEEYLRRSHPAVVLVPVPSDDAGLRMLSFGEVDGMVLDQASASYLIRREGLANLMIGTAVGFRYDLRMAWRRELTGVGEAVNRGLAALTPEERQAVRSRWLPLERAGEAGTSRRLAAVGLGLILLSGTAFVGWWLNRSRRARLGAAGRSFAAPPGGWSRDRELIEEAGRLRMAWLPWAVLLGSLAITFTVWRGARLEAKAALQARFDFRTQEVVESIRRRLEVNEQVLRGAQGLFAASGEVTRAGFRAYVGALRLEENYPGIQGVGFSLVVPARDRDRHLAAIRQEGFPDYALRPDGERDPLTSIVFLEPFAGRNLRAFGYDMFSEPIRRAAMEGARDRGEATISGKVTLVQETSATGQAGFLMYLPVYRAGAPGGTEVERRAALRGWVYSPLRMDDLMKGILGEARHDLGVEIYDGGEVSAAELMTGAEGPFRGVVPGSWFTATRRIDFGGRAWTIRLGSLPDFEAQLSRDKEVAAAGGGTAFGLGLALVTWLLVHGRERALRIARAMNRDLAESEERWAFAVEGAGDSAFDWDLESGRTVTSRRWSEMLGEPGGAAGTEAGIGLERVHPDDLPRARAALQACLDGREPLYVSEHRVRCGDGSWKWVLDRGMVVGRAPDGRPLRMVGTHGDVTGRKRAEQELGNLRSELERRVAQLEEANRDLEGFSYSVSHDLRAPLRAIDGFSSKLEAAYGGRLDDEGRRLVGVVRANALKMGRLIDGLLAFSRVGRAEMRRVRIPMEELVRAAFVEVVPDPGDRGRIELSVAPVPDVWGDPATIGQVWVNLLGNAVKYSVARERPVIEVGSRNGGGEIRFEVRDNGVGFDMAYAGKLFGVFQRLHSPREFEGTGIGLALVKRIVERHGGEVGAEAEPGRGATFWFTLPCAPGQAEPDRPVP